MGILNIIEFYVQKYTPHDYFHWVAIYLKIVGLKPPVDHLRKKILYTSLMIPHYVTFTAILLLQEWYELYVSHDDFAVAMLNMSYDILNFVFVYRIYDWFLIKDKFDKVISILRRSSFSFEVFSIQAVSFSKASHEKLQGKNVVYKDMAGIWSEAKIISQTSNNVEKYKNKVMLYTRAVCCLLFIMIVSLAVTDVIIMHLQALMEGTYEKFNEKRNKTSTYRKLPFNLYYPFDTSLSDGYYWLVFFHQFFVFSSISITVLPIFSIVTNTIIHLRSQVIVVNEAFKYIEQNLDAAGSCEAALLIKKIRLIKCINELQQIYRAIELLEQIFSIQFLVQYSISVFILCAISYVIPGVNNPMIMISMLILIGSVLGEIFVFCFCSHTLTTEFENIIDQAYLLNWEDYPPSFKKILTFLLMRLQKPRRLTAGKLFRLDLFFFTYVVQKAYSFHTLISQTRK